MTMAHTWSRPEVRVLKEANKVNSTNSMSGPGKLEAVNWPSQLKDLVKLKLTLLTAKMAPVMFLIK